MSDESPLVDAPVKPLWKPLEAIDRRVLGVLIEKAKTTPEYYPLSLNALRTGCNQKNNRSPLMTLEEPQIEESLERLRSVGAVAMVQGGGRIDRYRHLAYEWLGVEKAELAVMAELLLRGAQTVGELRGRAARMEPIKELGELMPILDALQTKRLVKYLTPPGRGSIVAHALYLDRELDKVYREAGAGQTAPGSLAPREEFRGVSPPPVSDTTQSADVSLLREQFKSLREELAAVKRELETVRQEFAASTDNLRVDLDELNRQLGN